MARNANKAVITSYSIHYTKLYEALLALGPDLSVRDGSGRTALDAAFLHPGNVEGAAIAELLVSRITSYNVCYTKLLRRATTTTPP